MLSYLPNTLDSIMNYLPGVSMFRPLFGLIDSDGSDCESVSDENSLSNQNQTQLREEVSNSQTKKRDKGKALEMKHIEEEDSSKAEKFKENVAKFEKQAVNAKSLRSRSKVERSVSESCPTSFDFDSVKVQLVFSKPDTVKPRSILKKSRSVSESADVSIEHDLCDTEVCDTNGGGEKRVSFSEKVQTQLFRQGSSIIARHNKNLKKKQQKRAALQRKRQNSGNAYEQSSNSENSIAEGTGDAGKNACVKEDKVKSEEKSKTAANKGKENQGAKTATRNVSKRRRRRSSNSNT